LSTLDNLRKSAKRWLKALRDGDGEARARLQRAYPDAAAEPTLRDVQHALAREHGHDSWHALTRAVIAETAGARADTPLTTLLAAADRGDAAAVNAILDEHPTIIDERGLLDGHTGLRTALHFGVHHEPVVRALLDRRANPNIRDEGDNAYPLHFAAERGDLPVVRLLIEDGADPSGAGTVHLLDVLGWAVCFDYAMHVDVARYLLAHGAPLTLLPAVALGEADAIRDLARAGASADAAVDLNQRMDRTNYRRTPLHLAIVKKQPASLRVLIDLGADLNLEDAVGLTPLDHAALAGDPALVDPLLDAGAIISLPAAVVLDRRDRVEQLIREIPDVMSPASERRWSQLIVHAAHRATGQVMDTLLRVVMRHRAGLSIVNAEADAETAPDGVGGYTPLHAAAVNGNDDAVAVLLRHGANPRARDRKYCATPASWARYMGHTDTATRIIETADIDLFDAVDFDRADRIAHILDADPAAIDRPFKAYASCDSDDPGPDTTPLQFATQRKKPHAIRILTERGADTRTPDQRLRAERIASFLRAACWDHHVSGKRDHRLADHAAQRLLAQDPSIAGENLYTAIVCGDVETVTRILTERPEAARERGGARNWTPILYLTYTRFTHPATIENDHAITIGRMLLDNGADPNDFYMAGDARYTALTGVAGDGEQDAPRQPYASAMFALLLQRGAEPFDVQILYNTHFSGDMLWWLDLVYTHTIATPRGEAWKDPEWRMFDMGRYGTGARFVIETAIKTRRPDLAEWALARGANPNARPAQDQRFPQHSLYGFARLAQQPAIAELLVRHGATRSTAALAPRDQFLDACFRLDVEHARALASAHPEYLRTPHAMFQAAQRDRADVLALLLDLGAPLESQDPHGKRTLHEAAYYGSLAAARFLIDRGADVDPIESTYDNTPIGWATHNDQREMIQFLSRYSRDIWNLCQNGCVDRVREILAENPDLARRDNRLRGTPLWALPDDEATALQIVDLLLNAGADPAVTTEEGHTPADWARRRGMESVARRIESALRIQAERDHRID
jgi:uncharacterized protein